MTWRVGATGGLTEASGSADRTMTQRLSRGSMGLDVRETLATRPTPE